MQRLDLRITDIATGGEGIAHAPDGRVVFVRGGIPDDRAEVDVDESRARMMRGHVKRVLEPSPDRVEPACPHVADGCGGCDWQHVAPDAQGRLKRRIAEESLRRIGRLTATVEAGPDLPHEGFRTTVRCLVNDGRAAFRAARSHDPVAVERCLVAHPGLDELIGHGYFGAAEEVTLRIGAATGERLVIVAPSDPGDLRLPSDVRVVGVDQLRRGERAHFHDVVDGRRFRISARSFFQTRTDGAAALVAAVRLLGQGHWGRGHLIDLYGGVGLFAATLGGGMRVTDVEANRSAAADARVNLADLDARVIRRSAHEWRPEPADVVVADPPRTGLGAQVVDRVAATGARRVVLVSCDPAAFGRDARLLTDAGYGLRRSMAIDLFPSTSHIELVSRFDLIQDHR